MVVRAVGRGVLLLLCWALLTTLPVQAACIPRTHQSGLQSALGQVQQLRFQGALTAAREESDPLLRAQAELYVFHQGGDLDGALAAGLSGLLRAPEDPWLLEQTAFVALTLGLGRRAANCLGALERVAPGQAPPWMAERARELQDQHEREQAALKRARRTSVAILLLACLCVGFAVLKQVEHPARAVG